jgi:hypothetical protein
MSIATAAMESSQMFLHSIHPRKTLAPRGFGETKSWLAMSHKSHVPRQLAFDGREGPWTLKI